MRFSADWLDPGVSGSRELRATFCLLEIEVGGKLVSRLFDSRRDRVHRWIAMPAYPLAQGFAGHWWRLIAGRSGSLGLRRFRDGFAVPDVRFRPDGRYVEIQAFPFEYENPPVNFLTSAYERSPVDAFERDASDFIGAVLEHLEANAVRRTWLAERWDLIQASMEDDAERLFCEAAGSLGLDPYTCDDEDAERIESAGAWFEDDELREFLAGQDPAGVRRALEWVRAAEAAVGEKAQLPDLPDIAQAARSTFASEPLPSRPWEYGYRLARRCREILDLPTEPVFADADIIARRFGNASFQTAAGRVAGLRAETIANGAAKIVLAELPSQTSRTFAMMRAIGDFVAFGRHGRSPITDTYSYRQGVGRAFAVEMLAPAEIILQMERDGMTAEEIGAARHVSEVAVERHLENHREKRASA